MLQLIYSFNYITLGLLEILPLVEPLPPPSLLEQLLLKFLEGTRHSVEVLLRKRVVQVFHEEVVLSAAIFDFPSHLVVELQLFLDHHLLLLAQDGAVHPVEVIEVLEAVHVHGGLGSAQPRRPRSEVSLLVERGFIVGENFSSIWVVGHKNLRLVVIILNKVFTPEEQLASILFMLPSSRSPRVDSFLTQVGSIHSSLWQQKQIYRWRLFFERQLLT